MEVNYRQGLVGFAAWCWRQWTKQVATPYPGTQTTRCQFAPRTSIPMNNIKALIFFLAAATVATASNYGAGQRESIEWCDLWLPHANEPDARLPRVLLIGDSITRGYYPAVERRLAGKAQVGRLTTSAFLSDPMLRKEIELVLDAQTFDVIQFNNGMHGWSHPEQEYRDAFPGVLDVIRRHAPNAKLVWANTTPLNDQPNAAAGEPARADEGVDRGKLMLKADLAGRSNARVAARNAIANSFVNPLGIPTVDLNSAMRGHPEYYRGEVHFNPHGIEVQAEMVAAEIEAVLRGNDHR